MNTSQDISNENIRLNWQNYKDELCNTPRYESLWDDLINKSHIDKNDMFLPILKKFISNHNENINIKMLNGIYINQINDETLTIEGLDGYERKEVHQLCDKIGLHHASEKNPKRKKEKIFYIYKPKTWLWEYTEMNSYSYSKEKLSNKYCCICQNTGSETDLFSSPYIGGLYCSDCLENESDGEGGILGDHKFEPL